MSVAGPSTAGRSTLVMRSTSRAVVLFMLLTTSVAGMGVGPVAAEAVGVSDAGVTPIVMAGDKGGNVTCAEIGSEVTLSSSDRLNWQGGQLVGRVPEGLEASVIDDRFVTWASTFPISAVIVKGGPATNVYVYSPMLLADAGLVAPIGSSGQPADVSNVTFCWDPDPTEPPPVDLLQVCMDAAVSADVGPIVSVAGPIQIRDGAVMLSSVPEGLVLTYDTDSDQVGFIAPFPVVVVVTATSAHQIHHIVPPSTSGTVPLSSNSGHGDVALCGLETSVVTSASCADVGADLEIGPVLVRGGVIDPAEVPEEISSLWMNDDSMVFTSTVPILGLLVTASPTELHTFDEPMMTASIPMTVDEETDVELMFCALRLTVVNEPGPDPDPSPNPTTDAVVTVAQDPILIAAGGGPPGRTSLSLFALVVLALFGTTTALLRSRSD